MNLTETPEKAIELIKRWEGLELKAYPDLSGVMTIGYGTTKYPNGKKVQNFDKITEEQANEYLALACQEIINFINTKIFVDLNLNQSSALISLMYNIGVQQFRYSLLLKYVSENKLDEAADEFTHWCFSNGVRINGLLKRREEEKALFLTPINQ
jgi:lysozyme